MRFALVGILFWLSNFANSQELSPMNKYGEPAAIELVAPSAVVVNVNGKQTITLNDVDKLAGIVGALHKSNRTMDAFPTAELSAAWNSCNAMKEEKRLWNKDGFNSIVIFHSGTDSDAKNTHLAKAPLVTAPKDTSRTSGKEEGIARLMLVNAKMNANTLSFDIKGGAIVSGAYQRVRIITECVFQ